jgi:glycosyltransferase involved in cell wall biosynthesis
VTIRGAILTDLTFVLPVHNVDKLLKPKGTTLIDLLAELHVPFELIIVDDGSTDDTLHEANELASHYNQVRVIHRSMRYGRDAAVQHVLQHISSPFVMILGDITRPVTMEIRRLWEARYRRLDAPQSPTHRLKGHRNGPELEFVRPELVTCGRVILLRQARHEESHFLDMVSGPTGAVRSGFVTQRT